ncbi:MAG TPA: hypothetical protein VHF06_26090 [Pseudonocardiaceae bacterium]|jgi:3-hydroxyacyl-[acyl-carrier-protein] dehydratase|nr:hypothetical protein [Pseudonocardiaceae bacterium]
MNILVDPADPVFEGHYPGFPILPGLFLLEHVLKLVRRPGLTFAGLERAKFARPVRPGDVLSVDTAWDGGLCVASVSTKDGPVADFRLRFAS